MSISPLAAAKRICERSGWTISNLKLQKILYMAQLAYMGENAGEPLIEGQFEAWNYGPVEPSVYSTFAKFGRMEIPNVLDKLPNADKQSNEIRSLDRYTDELLRYTPPALVSMTHWEGGAWAKNYQPGVKGIIIPPADILAEYKARAQS